MTMHGAFRTSFSTALRGGALMALAVSIAACSSVDRPSARADFPSDYKQRHPIVLRNAAETHDVYVTGSALDRREVEDLKSYAALYKRYGKDRLTISVPRGAGEDAAADRALRGIRLVLSRNGVPANRIAVTSYNAGSAVGSPPIRMSFSRFTAEVDSKCGLWPSDVSVGPTLETWENRDYWNFGCAYQTHLANQVNDPRDFIAGRTETPPDTIYRMKVFQKYRDNGPRALAGDDAADLGDATSK